MCHEPETTEVDAHFYMVWNEADRMPRVGHGSYSAAKGEARRLARRNPGMTFIVLHALTKHKSKPTGGVTCDALEPTMEPT